jgi:hypothetical protein
VTAIGSCGCGRPSPASLAAGGQDVGVSHERKRERGGELEGPQGDGDGESAWVKWGRLGWGKKGGHFTFSLAPDSSQARISLTAKHTMYTRESRPRIAAGIKKNTMIVREYFSKLTGLIIIENFGDLGDLVAVVANSLI